MRRGFPPALTLSLRQKLLLGMGLPFLVLAGVVAGALGVFYQVTLTYQAMLTRESAAVQQALTLQSALESQATAVRGFLLTDDPSLLQEAARAEAQQQAARAALRALLTDPEDLTLLTTIEEADLAYDQASRQIVAAWQQGDHATALHLQETREAPAREAVHRAAARLVASESEHLQQAIARTQTTVWHLTLLLISTSALALALVAWTALTISRSLIRTVDDLRRATARMAAGDLTTPIEGPAQDELGRLRVGIEHLRRALLREQQSARARLRDVEELAHSLSHDLRTPLGVIRGVARVLGQRYHDALPAEAHLLLRRLEDAVEYIEGLLADVVTLLRAGAPAEPPRPVLLAPLVREVAEALAIPAPALTIALPDQPVWGYPRQLRQLFSNLLENAVKYARPDVPLRLWVTGEARHGLLTVRLCDNGRGVPAEHLERIFEPFYRLALPESEDPGGSGIGLAVARRIVGAHGGTIRALPADHGPGLCLEMTFLLAGGEEPLVRPALPGRPPAAPQPAERPARASGVGGV